MDEQPKIQVGILVADEINFELQGNFSSKVLGKAFKAGISANGIILQSDNNETKTKTGKEFLFESESTDSSFLLKGVIIGLTFHWEQKEDQRFRGDLKLIIEGGRVRAINIVPLEEYLRSVISSEMSVTSSLEFLKAHAVISRSWLLAQIKKSKKLKDSGQNYQTSTITDNEIIRWYDREDHTLFDVCADDHCQRYQGISKIINEKASKAIDSTFGEVLTYNDQICDARFSKCCGGISENFEKVWEPVYHPYLTKVVDSEYAETTCVDLRQEEEAELWIRNAPDAFCNTTDKEILKQLLPNFDQSTTDFFRWELTYSQDELSSLIKKRSGIDFGQIIKLEAVERGHSSRIVKLKIVGTTKSLLVGKELEIRRILSEKHLYSSAFVIDHLEIEQGIPQRFEFTGAGWGHGVGLCQIGAAVMGEKGYLYKTILKHYFRRAKLEKLY